MSITTPNKETVRRICRLYGATECYLNIHTSDDAVEVLTDIPNNSVITCEQELQAWAGMLFRVYNYSSPSLYINKIYKEGEKILPIII